MLTEHDTAAYLESAYVVRFGAINDTRAQCSKLFEERWQAEAFVNSCTPAMEARVVILYERKEGR